MHTTHTNRTWMLVGMSLALLVGLLLPLGVVKAVPVAAEPATVHRVHLPLVVGGNGQPATPIPPDPPITLSEGEAHLITAVNAARVAAGCPAAIHKPALSLMMRWRANRTSETGVLIPTTTISLYQGNYVWGMVWQTHHRGGSAAEALAAWLGNPDDAALLLDCFEHTAPAPMYDPTTAYAIGVGEAGGVWVIGVGSMTHRPLVDMTDREHELRAMTLINTARVRAGCPVARVGATLTTAARDWAETSRKQGIFEHAPYGWYQGYGYYYGALENLAGAAHGDGAVESWWASPPHRRNMLSCEDPNEPIPTHAIYDLGVGTYNGRWVMGLATIFPGIIPPP
ncbi:MAG: CAP domain-containing protein [Oscillochloridaceae bacterium umkhey_bin13]